MWLNERFHDANHCYFRINEMAIAYFAREFFSSQSTQITASSPNSLQLCNRPVPVRKSCSHSSSPCPNTSQRWGWCATEWAIQPGCLKSNYILHLHFWIFALYISCIQIDVNHHLHGSDPKDGITNPKQMCNTKSFQSYSSLWQHHWQFILWAKLKKQHSINILPNTSHHPIIPSTTFSWVVAPVKPKRLLAKWNNVPGRPWNGENGSTSEWRGLVHIGCHI